jgi:hypothetical protein
MQAKNIIDLAKKLAIVLIGAQCIYPYVYVDSFAVAQTQTSVRQSSQSSLPTSVKYSSKNLANASRLVTDAGAAGVKQSIERTPSAAGQSVTQTATNLHRLYQGTPMSRESAIRKQQWWAKEYSRRQQLQRFTSWKRRKEDADYVRRMADRRSPEARGYRNIASRAQSLQAKSAPEQRTKIALYPIMTPANKGIPQIHPTSISSSGAKQTHTAKSYR